MTEMIKIEKNVLILNSGKTVTFPDNISDFKVCNNLIVILLSYNTSKPERNVVAVDNEGNIVWSIDALSDVKLNLDKDCPFTGIDYNGEVLTAYNWCGFICVVDLETGKIKETQFTK